MVMKLLVARATATAVLGVAATGAFAMAATAPATHEVRPAVFDIPVPLNPAADLPSAEQIVSLLSGIADPNVSAADKSGLVEDGLGPIERNVMDGRMKKGVENGKLPLTISAANIEPAGTGAATADVTGSGPKTSPRSVNLTFVNDDGWKLSHSSLTTLSQMSSSN